MKKLIVLLLCLLGSSSLWAQDNTVLGTGALAQISTPKYAIQSIQVVNNGGYSRPTIDMGSYTVQWDYQYIDVSKHGVYVDGYIRSSTNLGNFVPSLIGGHGTGATLYMFESNYDGTNYYYEIYSDNPGSGYVPEVSLSSFTGNSYGIYTIIDENGELQIYYDDNSKTNLYTTAPTVSISFGSATATAILEGTAANGQNTAIGYQALYSSTDGKENTALGYQSLYNSTGNSNLGLGFMAGNSITSGSNNLFIGKNAGNGITTGSGNVFIGNGSSTSLNNTLNNTLILADGGGTPKLVSFANGNTKIGFGNDFNDTGFKLDVNGTINATNQVRASRVVTKDVSLRSPQSNIYQDFLLSAFDPNTLQLRTVVDVNNFPTVFSVDKQSASMTFYTPVKGVNAVHSNEFVTLGQLASGQTIGANILGNASSSSILTNHNISGHDMITSSLTAAGSFTVMNGERVIGAPTLDFWNILSLRHNNVANDYRTEIAGSFFDAGDIKFRNTNNNPAQGWNTFFHSGNTNYVKSTLGLPTSGGFDLQSVVDRGLRTLTRIEIGEGLQSTTNAPMLKLRGANVPVSSGDGTLSIYSSTWNPTDKGVNTGGSISFGGQSWTGSAGNSVMWGGIAGLKEDIAGNYNGYLALYTSAYNGSTLEKMRISSSGNVGIGNTNPLEKLEVSGNIRVDRLRNTDAVFSNNSRNSFNSLNSGMAPGVATGWITADFGANDNTSDRLVVGTGWEGKAVLGTHNYNLTQWGGDLLINPEANGGNVGIGTSSPKEKLSVNGKIRAREVKVEPTNNWPDYVFEDDYKLMSLADLEKFIKINKHLPEIPTAKAVLQDGIELGEMNKLLLKKIEEMTLFLIEKDKQLEQTNKNLNHLKEQVDKLLNLNHKQ